MEQGCELAAPGMRCRACKGFIFMPAWFPAGIAEFGAQALLCPVPLDEEEPRVVPRLSGHSRWDKG